MSDELLRVIARRLARKSGCPDCSNGSFPEPGNVHIRQFKNGRVRVSLCLSGIAAIEEALRSMGVGRLLEAGKEMRNADANSYVTFSDRQMLYKAWDAAKEEVLGSVANEA